MVIKDICEVYSGYAFKEFNDHGEGVPVIKIGNILKNGTLDLVNCQHTSETVDDKYYSRNRDIYVALSGATTGKIGILSSEERFVINQRVGIVRKKDNEIPTEYIKYFLMMQTERILKDAAGCAQPNISPKQIEQYSIPQFNRTRMEIIVDTLNRLENIITQRKLELKTLNELIKARFVEMFGHQSHNEKDLPYMTVDDVAEIYLGITHTPEYVEEGVTFISAKNTSGDFLDLSDVKYISREEFETAPIGSKPRRNDVLFSRVGSNLGHPVILDDDIELCTFVSLGFLRTKGKVTSNYLKHWMRDEYFPQQVLEHVKGGGQPNLNTGWLKQFKIIVPRIEAQQEFDAFCEQVDKSKVA